MRKPQRTQWRGSTDSQTSKLVEVGGAGGGTPPAAPRLLEVFGLAFETGSHPAPAASASSAGTPELDERATLTDRLTLRDLALVTAR